MGLFLAFVTVLWMLCATTEARRVSPCPLHEQTGWSANALQQFFGGQVDNYWERYPKKLYICAVDRKLRFEEREDPVLVSFEEHFQKITCEVANYCNITWTKDGRPVKESSTVQIKNEQQWLTFRRLSLEDAGHYACEATNDRETIRQDISLNVISTDCTTDLQPIDLQHAGCQNISARLGDDVSFDCRFYVGMQKDISSNWYKVNTSAAAPDDFANYYIDLSIPLGGVVFHMSDNRSGEVPVNGKQCNCAGCLPVFGTKLSARNITSEVYGTYKIYIATSGRPAFLFLEISPALPTKAPVIEPRDWHHALTIPLVSLAGLSLVLLLGWTFFGVDIKLKVKDLMGKKDGSKTTDVYVSYDWNSETDRAFAMRLAHFLKKLGYKVCIEIDFLPGGETDTDIVECLKSSHCCIVVLSPDYLSSHRNLDVDFAMDNAKRYKKEIIPVIYRDISMAGAEQSVLVEQILSLPCLRYDRLRSSLSSVAQPSSRLLKVARSILPGPPSEKSLDKELLLRLPPRDRPAKKSSALLSMDSDQSLYPPSPQPVRAPTGGPTEGPGLYPPIQDLSRRLDCHINEGNLACMRDSPRTVFIPNGKLYPDISGLQNPAVSTYF